MSTFPATSIGRAHGANIAAHPLLSAPDAAKYVPYTPRRTAPAKLTSLKTAAQNIGLDANSLGWAILDKIAYEGDGADDWSEIWNTLIRGKAALLLPTEQGDTVTPEFVQDHVVLCDLAARENTAVVTLSGLRGHLVNDTLTFRSTLHRSTKAFQTILTTLGSRAASLDALPPLPVYPPESSYPSLTVSAFSTLPLPARVKPQLPPRPGTVRASSAQPARLAMPFASLFGQRPSTPPPSPAPVPTTAPLDTDTVDIAIFVTDTALSRPDIATGVISALRGELAAALADYPPWLVERVHAFSASLSPFVRVPAGKKKLQDIGGNPGRVVYAVNGVLERPDELAERFQAFYRAVEGELRSETGFDRTVEQGEERVALDEERIRDVLEAIEETLSTVLYDRLFLPSMSDDASHNEALSSRIAALNMLDLGLEHLDIAVGNANQEEVDAVVRTCGEALAQLDFSARSPREKAAVLVSAHKVVVDGLSKIPPVHLKSQDNEGTSSPILTKTGSPLVPTVHPSTSAEQQSAIAPPPNPEPAPPVTKSSAVSGDVLLPLLIFSVVKANPPRLVSHLLFTQRFRNQSFSGEESYCLINLMAVAEFLENVDLTALGLGESAKKVLSTAYLTPIPIARPPSLAESPIATTTNDDNLAILRGRVGQGVDAIAGSANKVISGVVDSSFGVLRALLPGQTASVSVVPGSAVSATSGSAPGSAVVGTGGPPNLPRRETSFSLAGLTATFPSGTGKPKVQNDEQGQREMVEVSSRPGSLRSRRSGHESGSEEGASEEADEGGSAEEDDSDEADEAEDDVHDTQSIKSFESMLSGARAGRKTGAPPGSSATPRRKRLSGLTNRITHGMAGMSRRVQGQPSVTLAGRFPLPNRRFVECTEQDLRVAEVGELLHEYQRLVEAVRNAGGFQE